MRKPRRSRYVVPPCSMVGRSYATGRDSRKATAAAVASGVQRARRSATRSSASGVGSTRSIENPPLELYLLSTSGGIGVGRIAQPVAEEIEREDDDEHRHHREHQPGIERDH